VWSSVRAARRDDYRRRGGITIKAGVAWCHGNRSRKVGWLTPEFIRAKWNFLRARWNVTFESEINHYESMLKMVEAGGVGILSLIDNAQLIDFNKREKRQNQRIRQSEVHGGYMGFRKSR
jgi:hypothetical protein